MQIGRKELCISQCVIKLVVRNVYFYVDMWWFWRCKTNANEKIVYYIFKNKLVFSWMFCLFLLFFAFYKQHFSKKCTQFAKSLMLRIKNAGRRRKMLASFLSSFPLSFFRQDVRVFFCKRSIRQLSRQLNKS